MPEPQELTGKSSVTSHGAVNYKERSSMMKRLTLVFILLLALIPASAALAQTYPAPETESTNTPVDVDVDTGAKAEGAVDVDVSTTPDADTDASGINETGETDTAADSDALPSTAGELPTVALIGLLAFGAFFLVRARRNA
jgi:hypothetical protein